MAGLAFVGLVAGVVVFLSLNSLAKSDQWSSVLGGLVALLGVPSALETLARMWRGASADPATSELTVVADQLSVAVRSQWDAEASVRRVNDPYPLPVAWQAADVGLAEPWDQLAQLARSWPGGPPGTPDLWPQDIEGLAGQDAAIGKIFSERVPTRRLVVLGEPGAGKSVLLIRLLQDILTRRTGDDPVPVIFSLASWHPDQPLQQWLADQLRRAYPGLQARARSITGDISGDLAQALLETGRILPLLDGFDELPPHLHPAALDALNRALPDRRPLVLAARSDAYRTALAGPGPTLRLNGAAAIRLLPLDPSRAAAYLRRDAGGVNTPAAARWNTVSNQLGTDSPAGRALSTPLGLFLARAIYNPRPGHAPDAAVPHPNELCDTTRFADRAAVDRHLFHAFIPAAYAPHGPRPPRWSPEQARRAFTLLARFQEAHRRGSPDLAWWQLRQAVPTYLQCLAGGLVAGLVGVLISLIVNSRLLGAPDYYGDGGTGSNLVIVVSVVTTGLACALIGRRTYGPVGAALFPLLGIAGGAIAFFLAVALVSGLEGKRLLVSIAPGRSGLFEEALLGFLTGAVLGCLAWHPSRRSTSAAAGPRQLRQQLVGGLSGVVVIAAIAVGWALFRYGLAVTLVGGLAGGLAGELTGRRIHHRTGGLTTGASGGLAASLATAALIKALRFEEGMISIALAVGLIAGIVTVVIDGATRRIAPRTPDLSSYIGASRVFTWDRRCSLTVGFVFASTAGIALGLLYGTSTGDKFALDFGQAYGMGLAMRIAVGFVAALATGLAAATAATAWPFFVMARTYLALRRQAPRDLMAFLRDAHEHRGVLRQVGPFYQFRHIDLQRHLAQS
ncbi:NACHT domain-containing protein [Streptomyces diacarni]|uniref:NACHT domain-containing protein n=1 Tax=Streptomyces diacarni TaxID=2800381 RepID=UPI0015F03050|nr:NACHT domain-containing protein [Streptomyces diacarni]